MTQFIDRRSNAKNKSAVNRQRFLRRYKRQIKNAVSQAVSKRSITDIDQAETISIPSKDLNEPRFAHGEGGTSERIFPGNKEFKSGDHIKRPAGKSGKGGGDSEASKSGEGDDDFIFTLTREEFLDVYFDDLELPDLVKKELTQIPNYKFVRAGVTTTGVPTNINVVRSMKQAMSRRKALGSMKTKKLRALEEQLETLLKTHSKDSAEVFELKKQISKVKTRIQAIPFIDTIDLRFNARTKQSQPSTQAVMFCIMDVSGSMDEAKKEIAKRFFILLYLFLTKTYEKIELVFIRHHTSAKEVTEEEFFYSRETGGTVVSSALEKMIEVIQQRYPSDSWNIYAAQASDGDNWNADSPYCQELLSDKIMPCVQYYAYVEIMPRHHQSLWEVYKNVHELYPNFSMENITGVDQIYPVFRDLFKRKVK